MKNVSELLNLLQTSPGENSGFPKGSAVSPKGSDQKGNSFDDVLGKLITSESDNSNKNSGTNSTTNPKSIISDLNTANNKITSQVDNTIGGTLAVSPEPVNNNSSVLTQTANLKEFFSRLSDLAGKDPVQAQNLLVAIGGGKISVSDAEKILQSLENIDSPNLDTQNIPVSSGGQSNAWNLLLQILAQNPQFLAPLNQQSQVSNSASDDSSENVNLSAAAGFSTGNTGTQLNGLLQAGTQEPFLFVPGTGIKPSAHQTLSQDRINTILKTLSDLGANGTQTQPASIIQETIGSAGNSGQTDGQNLRNLVQLLTQAGASQVVLSTAQKGNQNYSRVLNSGTSSFGQSLDELLLNPTAQLAVSPLQTSRVSNKPPVFQANQPETMQEQTAGNTPSSLANPVPEIPQETQAQDQSSANIPSSSANTVSQNPPATQNSIQDRLASSGSVDIRELNQINDLLLQQNLFNGLETIGNIISLKAGAQVQIDPQLKTQSLAVSQMGQQVGSGIGVTGNSPNLSLPSKNDISVPLSQIEPTVDNQTTQKGTGVQTGTGQNSLLNDRQIGVSDKGSTIGPFSNQIVFQHSSDEQPLTPDQTGQNKINNALIGQISAAPNNGNQTNVAGQNSSKVGVQTAVEPSKPVPNNQNQINRVLTGQISETSSNENQPVLENENRNPQQTTGLNQEQINNARQESVSTGAEPAPVTPALLTNQILSGNSSNIAQSVNPLNNTQTPISLAPVSQPINSQPQTLSQGMNSPNPSGNASSPVSQNLSAQIPNSSPAFQDPASKPILNQTANPASLTPQVTDAQNLTGSMATMDADKKGSLQNQTKSSANLSSGNNEQVSVVQPVTAQAVTAVGNTGNSSNLNSLSSNNAGVLGSATQGLTETNLKTSGSNEDSGKVILAAGNSAILNQANNTSDNVTLFRQVSDQITAHAAESKMVTSLNFQLVPANLGRITVQVSLVDQAVSARIVVSNPDVKDALQQNLVNLKAALSQSGLQIDQLQVHVQGGSTNLLAQYFQYQQEGFGVPFRGSLSPIPAETLKTPENDEVLSPVSLRTSLVDLLV